MDLPSFDLRLLPSFVVVARELHFGRAAERLSVAQPALSRQIARLEQELGVVLFDRSSRGVELTADGATLLDAALDVLRHAERAAGVAHLDESVVRVHLSDSVPPEVVVAVQAAIAAEPDLRVTVLDGRHVEATRAVLEGRADAGFEFLEGVPDGLVYAPLCRQRWGVLCVEGHPLARSSTASWRDLDGLRLLTAPPGVLDGYNLALTAALRRFDVSAEQVEGPRDVSPCHLQTFLAAGDAVLACAEYIVSPRVPGVRWVPLLPEAAHEWGVVWDRARVTAGVRRFVARMRLLGGVALPDVALAPRASMPGIGHWTLGSAAALAPAREPAAGRRDRSR